VLLGCLRCFPSLWMERDHVLVCVVEIGDF